jgi:hypothetical protein
MRFHCPLVLPAVAGPLDRSQELRFQNYIACPGTSCLCVDHHIVLTGNVAECPAKNFPEQALDTISDYRIADFPRNRNPEAMVPGTIVRPKQYKPVRVDLPSRLVNLCVVGRSGNPNFTGKSLGRRASHSLSAFCALWRAVASAPVCRLWWPFSP